MFAHDAVRRQYVSTSEKVGGVYSSLAFFAFSDSDSTPASVFADHRMRRCVGRGRTANAFSRC